MNYRMKKISDLFSDIKIGGTPPRGNPQFFNGNNLWVSIKDMDGKSQITSTAEKLSDEGVANSNCKRITKGSLLFSFKLTVGKVAFAGSDLYTNEAIAAFDPIEAQQSGIDLGYLSMVLPIAAKSDRTKNSMGASLLSKERIYELLVPVPDTIDEQKEIFRKFNAQFGEIEKARIATELKKNEAQAILLKQQEEVLKILAEIPRAPLREYLTGIEAGKSIKTTELPAKKDELGVLKVSAVSWTEFRPDEAKSVISDHNPPESHRVKSGDVIITRANGSLRLVGAGVLVEKDYPNRLLSDKTLRLKIKTEKANAKYLLNVLRLPEARKYIEENATGSQSMRNISQKKIFNIPIPQADKKQQEKIIQILDDTSWHLSDLNLALDNVLNDLNILPQKLLHEAFQSEQ
ncbi:MAG: hypothetical protein EOO15_00395 [Chitinophagaceae bacterium]|nr:MAG: hypothetical protein EOO15_00395 [Chitinophagaceae bacterium]